LAVDLRRRLLAQINGHGQRVTGPSIKSAEELRQTVLTSANLTHYIQRYSARRKITLVESRKEASKYVDEIAAKYSLRFIALGSAITRWFLKNIFDDVNFESNHLHFEYAYLKNLFANEFFFDPDKTIVYQVRKTVKAFIDDTIIVPHPTLQIPII
jgi:glycerol-3-phosphate O-acyltransferase